MLDLRASARRELDGRLTPAGTRIAHSCSSSSSFTRSQSSEIVGPFTFSARSPVGGVYFFLRRSVGEQTGQVTDDSTRGVSSSGSASSSTRAALASRRSRFRSALSRASCVGAGSGEVDEPATAALRDGLAIEQVVDGNRTCPFDAPMSQGLLAVVVLQATLPTEHETYAVISLVGQHDSERFTSGTASGQTPVYDYECRLRVHQGSTLVVELFTVEHAPIGRGEIQIQAQAWPDSQFDDWVPLHHDGAATGEVFLEMTY